jgi:predicted Zn-dependent protease
MYNLLIAIGAGLLSFVALSFALGAGSFKPLYGLVPGLFVVGIAYFYLARRTMRQVEEIMKRAQEILAKAQSSPNMGQKRLNKVIDEAIGVLKEGYPLDKWQFWVKAQLDGQIGTLLYMAKKYDVAEKYLVGALKRHWMAKAMLGSLYYKRKSVESMTEAFEEAVDGSKKESLLWNLYAYCLWKSNKQDEAIAVLNRALEHIPTDEKTQDNLKALQNNRKMKMRGWNMMWYQFHLDAPPQPRAQAQFRRR